MQGHTHEGYHRDIGNLEALAAARVAAPAVFSSQSSSNQNGNKES
jgi:hypothetical protein